MVVRITTLGRTGIAVDGHEVDWIKTHHRRVELLLYLALEGEVPRDRVLGLFWPETPADRARNSLNQLLYTVRKSLGDDVVATAGDRLSLGAQVEVDAHHFMAAADAERHAEALHTYGGAFLCDFSMGDSVALEHWAEQYRARIARLHRKARRVELDRLQAADVNAALELAQEWVELEPDDDEAQHRYLELLIETGQRATALKHYTAYERLLAADGLQPLDETLELITCLRTGAPATPATALPVTVRPGGVGAAAAPVDESVGDGETVHFAWLSRLLGELRRRHVLRVAAIYGLIAWGAIEIAEAAFSILGLPEWAPRIVLLAALLAAPLVVVCAWYYDITPRGIKRGR